ncbi:MAG: class I SAM-dependent methyltransferase [Candidatus Electrothrix sp. AW2]|nr:class I SAM-dependent methyltransferase [Candidatus Electrothrix gigas]
MIFKRLSKLSRDKKNDLFFKIIEPNKETRILDIGAEVAGSNYSEQLIDIYPWKDKITAINISHNQIQAIKKKYPQIKAEVADALTLPYPDKSFDVVYSNAVIEHVVGVKEQKKFASEVMRVAKRYFVTTPNRWYPYEFHLRLPLVTLLPWNMYIKLGSILRFNHVQQKYMWFSGQVTGIKLLSQKEL